jgi:hydroxylamine reductase (hybrid-cluster protein)
LWNKVTVLPFAIFHLAALATSYAPAAGDDNEFIGKYVKAVQGQVAARRNLDLEVTIEARLSKLHRQATLRALRRVAPTGAVRYQILDVSGDDIVRREVIARYLAAESESQQSEELAITPAHYRFCLTATAERASQRLLIFQITPRKRQVGLFKGELWVDGQTGLPVHDEGQFVKSPSVFVKRIMLVRDYQVRDGLNLPIRLRSSVISRIAGRAELDIRITGFPGFQ